MNHWETIESVGPDWVLEARGRSLYALHLDGLVMEIHWELLDEDNPQRAEALRVCVENLRDARKSAR